jgi:hypothetical protein
LEEPRHHLAQNADELHLLLVRQDQRHRHWLLRRRRARHRQQLGPHLLLVAGSTH